MQELGNRDRTVVIVAPPWPRSGTSRVLQSQVAFYRGAGYRTVLIFVPLQWFWDDSYTEWPTIRSGMDELGADRSACAIIDRSRFRVTKYAMRIKRAFCDLTALDWMIATANSARAPKDLIRLLRESQVALVHVNHVFTLRFATSLISQLNLSSRNIPIILETHDIQANALEERGEINPWTRRFDSKKRLVEKELAYIEEAKVLVHLSNEDFNFFQSRLPGKEHVLVLPTIDESFVLGVQTGSDVVDGPIDLLFVGQRTDANSAAIGWFYEKVWPLIAVHGYRVKIVGQIEIKVRELLPAVYEAHKACFVGTVEELAPFYRAARCVFAPMVSGTGISIKTIEALALGKPFIGTSKAYRGMPMERIVEAGLEPYDSPEAFASAIVKVLSGKNNLADPGRRAYLDLFSKHAAYAARDRALTLAIAS